MTVCNKLVILFFDILISISSTYYWSFDRAFFISFFLIFSSTQHYKTPTITPHTIALYNVSHKLAMFLKMDQNI